MNIIIMMLLLPVARGGAALVDSKSVCLIDRPNPVCIYTPYGCLENLQE